MRILLVAAMLAVVATGCSAIQGERFWWNDQQQAKLDNNYELPEWPAETPLAAGETPYVDKKKFKPDEVERARKQEQQQISAGIPRCGVPDPLANPVKVKVAEWGSTTAAPADSAAPAPAGNNASADKATPPATPKK